MVEGTVTQWLEHAQVWPNYITMLYRMIYEYVLYTCWWMTLAGSGSRCGGFLRCKQCSQRSTSWILLRRSSTRSLPNGPGMMGIWWLWPWKAPFLIGNSSFLAFTCLGLEFIYRRVRWDSVTGLIKRPRNSGFGTISPKEIGFKHDLTNRADGSKIGIYSISISGWNWWLKLDMEKL